MDSTARSTSSRGQYRCQAWASALHTTAQCWLCGTTENPQAAAATPHRPAKAKSRETGHMGHFSRQSAGDRHAQSPRCGPPRQPARRVTGAVSTRYGLPAQRLATARTLPRRLDGQQGHGFTPRRERRRTAGKRRAREVRNDPKCSSEDGVSRPRFVGAQCVRSTAKPDARLAPHRSPDADQRWRAGPDWRTPAQAGSCRSLAHGQAGARCRPAQRPSG